MTPRTVGEQVGVEDVALTVGEIPSHTHDTAGVTVTIGAHMATNADQGTPSGQRVLGKFEDPSADLRLYTNSGGNLVPLGGASLVLGNEGRGEAHENRQPLLAINYIIALQGTFPSRN